MESNLKEMQISEQNAETILSEQTGQALESLHEKLKVNTWLSASEAVKFGLIDYIQPLRNTPPHPLHKPTTIPAAAMAFSP